MITLVSRFSTKLIINYFHLSMKSQFSFYQIFPITLLKVYSKDCKKFDICQLMEERDCFRNISVNSSSILLRHFSGIFPGISSENPPENSHEILFEVPPEGFLRRSSDIHPGVTLKTSLGIY